MNRWNLLPFILITGLTAIIVTLILILKPGVTSEPLKAVPADASVIIKINDFQGFVQESMVKSSIWNELKIIPEFNRLDKQIQFLDSLYRNMPEARNLLQAQPSYISAHFTGKERISFMHVYRLPGKLNEKKINDMIHGLIINQGTVNSRKYEGVTVYEVNLLNQQQLGNFSYAIISGNFLLSFSSIVLEDAIRQLVSDESIVRQKGFQEMFDAALKNASVDANIFINFRELPRSFSTLVRPEFKAEVRSFNTFSDWGELDVNTLSDALLLNGFVHIADSSITAASLFVNQNPQKITADEVLPATVSAFLTLSFSDVNKYFNDYHEYLRELGQFTGYSNTIRSLDNTYDVEFLNVFKEILDQEITFAFDAGNAKNDAVETLFIMRVKSQALAEEKLTGILNNIASVESKPMDAYTFRYRFDNELSFTIHHLPIKKLAGKLFGSLFAGLDEHFYVLLDNYLIFASSREVLQDLIASYILNKTLVTDRAYQDFKSGISSRSNICFYCKLGEGHRTFAKYLNPGLVKKWDTYKQVFGNVQVMGFQLYSNDGMLYNNLLVKHLSSSGAASPTVWESKLDTLTDFKPIFVLNHNTNQKEIFVQDLSHNIYLINQVGRILWKVRLNEKINSEIYQIDYYNNGKLQFMFSTATQLYLIDRNGNFVEKYPVKLRSPASCGMSLFDYDNNRNYRIFIPCEDRQVYVYDKEGTLVSGWDFGKTESIVNQPVQHFKVLDRDYIVFGDGLRTYILDRRGNIRTNVTTYFQKSAANRYFLDVSGRTADARLVTTDTAGTVYFIYLDGRINTFELAPYSNGHFFEYQDLNGDGSREYIFLEDNILTVYLNDKKKMFEIVFREEINDRPTYYAFSATDRRIGIVARNDDLIYLIDNNGTIHRNFPLQGNTPFSIGYLDSSGGAFNLLVGSRNHFLYNYQLN
ncbi:MAG: hypothetical protein JXB19_05400 [Bacteroidales bacterium]|nr:hypothetical protein [Bacteroidales bacterium]